MLKFFFNLRDGRGKITRDEKGLELPDLAAARRKARELARALLDAEAEIRHGRKPH